MIYLYPDFAKAVGLGRVSGRAREVMGKLSSEALSKLPTGQIDNWLKKIDELIEELLNRRNLELVTEVPNGSTAANFFSGIPDDLDLDGIRTLLQNRGFSDEIIDGVIGALRVKSDVDIDIDHILRQLLSGNTGLSGDLFYAFWNHLGDGFHRTDFDDILETVYGLQGRGFSDDIIRTVLDGVGGFTSDEAIEAALENTLKTSYRGHYSDEVIDAAFDSLQSGFNHSDLEDAISFQNRAYELAFDPVKGKYVMHEGRTGARLEEQLETEIRRPERRSPNEDFELIVDPATGIERTIDPSLDDYVDADGYTYNPVTAVGHPQFNIDGYIEKIKEHIKFPTSDYVVIDVQELFDAGMLAEVKQVYDSIGADLPNIIWIPPR